MQAQGSDAPKYLRVIALIPFGFVSAAYLFSFLLDRFVFSLYLPGTGTSTQDRLTELDLLVSVIAFVINPGIFFAVLYWYGRRTASLFRTMYKSAVVYLFVGALSGSVVYVAVIAIMETMEGALVGSASFQFWAESIWEVLANAVTYALIGMAPLALAYLRTVIETTPRAEVPTAPDGPAALESASPEVPQSES